MTSLDSLVAFTRELGRPELDYAILGEGNTSLWRDTESFWVTKSGQVLGAVDAASFVAVRSADVLALLDDDQATTALSIREQLTAAVCEGTGRPSTETVLHALALTLGGARAVGHTHPTPLMALLCSAQARRAAEGRLFPDEAIVCGQAPAFVPYTSPGLPLARAVRNALHAHLATWQEPPKVLLLENHGLIALGQTPDDVLHITAMCVKAARVLLGTFALGGPQFLDPTEVKRLASYRTNRPTLP